VEGGEGRKRRRRKEQEKEGLKADFIGSRAQKTIVYEGLPAVSQATNHREGRSMALKI